jgi:hypothetical protein
VRGTGYSTHARGQDRPAQALPLLARKLAQEPAHYPSRRRAGAGGEVIRAPPCILYLAILGRNYAGARENDLTAHG